MIKQIYFKRINSWVKEYVKFKNFADEAKSILDILQENVESITSEIEEIVESDKFSHHEKTLMIEDRLEVVDEKGSRITKLYSEVEELYVELIRNKKLLITALIDEDEKLSEDLIEQYLFIEIKKALNQ